MSKTLPQIKKLLLPLNYLKPLSSFILVLCFNVSFTQTVFKITENNDDPLIGVEIFSDDYSYTTVSDTDGKFTVPDNFRLSINLKYLGYKIKKIYPSQLIRDNQFFILMEKDDVLLEEVVVIGRTGVRKEETPYQIETISQKTLRLTNPQTSADALAANANVYVQKSQMGGGSPVIRGFEANKILLVLDGVRLNNAIYRSGHLQNAITIDQSILDRMEVIFGAGSLGYGSDALGGVIHFKSKEPLLNFNDNDKALISHGYYARHSTANKEKTIHYDLMYGRKKWGSLSSITYSKFGDLLAGTEGKGKYPNFGSRPNFISRINGIDSIVTNPVKEKQIGTAYKQLDILQKFLFQPTEDLRIVLNGQYSTSSDVPRYDRLTELDTGGNLRFAEWYYGPQNRLLLSAKSTYSKNNALFNKALIIASYQKIDEDRIDRQYRSDIQSVQKEDVNVIGLTIDFNKFLDLEDRSVLRYGVDLQHNTVKSDAYEQNIIDESQNFNVLSRYPSDMSTMASYGIYTQYTWKNKSKKLISNTGIRYSRSVIDLSYDSSDPFPWPQSFIDGLNSTNNSLVGSTGINYNTNSGWRFHALAATAFRAPNVDDMAKIRVKGNEVSVPNLNLNPEKSVNGELGFTKKHGASNTVSAAIFYTQLSDVIIREPLPLPDGSTFIMDGMDTLFTFGNINADRAKVYGFSLNINQKIFQKLRYNGSVNFTKGIAISENAERPLSHIPPVFGKTGLAWSYEKFNVEGVVRYNFKKKLEDFGDSTDNPELATPEGSLAWQTYNLYLSYPYFKWLSLSMGVENILNTHYRPFSSGVSAPGRNFIITLSGKF